jgi:C-methyltransferase C-terminal domain/Putative zinc binding domain/Methyltransferase domain
MIRTTCRSCEGPLEHVLDLGTQAPSNALLKSFDQPEKRYPLRAAVCTNCWLMQTEYDVPHAELFPADYPYYSGGSQQWREHCRSYAEYATKRFGLRGDSYVVEIGGNDGTMLQNFYCNTLNVEPSVNVARAAMSKSIPTLVGRIQDVQLNKQGADLIIANNVLAHDPDLNGFAAAIARGLAPDGTATIEFPWAVRLLENGAFDTMYHEHYSYFSLLALLPLFRRHGLHIYDVEYLPVHGGSLRVYAQHLGVARSSSEAIGTVLVDEEGLRRPRTYEVFRERAFNCAAAFRAFILEHPGQVYGAGAAAKATVFANFCALTSKDIGAIGDITPAKQGKWLPGSHIPIVSMEQLCAWQPKFIWIAAWNWREEIAARLRPMVPYAKFVAAVPELEEFT